MKTIREIEELLAVCNERQLAEILQVIRFVASDRGRDMIELSPDRQRLSYSYQSNEQASAVRKTR